MINHKRLASGGGEKSTKRRPQEKNRPRAFPGEERAIVPGGESEIEIFRRGDNSPSWPPKPKRRSNFEAKACKNDRSNKREGIGVP